MLAGKDVGGGEFETATAQMKFLLASRDEVIRLPGPDPPLPPPSPPV